MDVNTFAHEIINSADNDPEKVVERFVDLFQKKWMMDDGRGNSIYDEANLQKALQAVLNALNAAWSDHAFTGKVKAAFEAEKKFEGYTLFPDSEQEDLLSQPLREAGINDIAEMIGRTLILNDKKNDREFYFQIKGVISYPKDKKLVILIYPIKFEERDPLSPRKKQKVTVSRIVVQHSQFRFKNDEIDPSNSDKSGSFQVFSTARIF